MLETCGWGYAGHFMIPTSGAPFMPSFGRKIFCMILTVISWGTVLVGGFDSSSESQQSKPNGAQTFTNSSQALSCFEVWSETSWIWGRAAICYLRCLRSRRSLLRAGDVNFMLCRLLFIIEGLRPSLERAHAKVLPLWLRWSLPEMPGLRT